MISKLIAGGKCVAPKTWTHLPEMRNIFGKGLCYSVVATVLYMSGSEKSIIAVKGQGKRGGCRSHCRRRRWQSYEVSATQGGVRLNGQVNSGSLLRYVSRCSRITCLARCASLNAFLCRGLIYRLLTMKSARRIIRHLACRENLSRRQVCFCFVEPSLDKVPDDVFTASHR